MSKPIGDPFESSGMRRFAKGTLPRESAVRSVPGGGPGVACSDPLDDLLGPRVRDAIERYRISRKQLDEASLDATPSDRALERQAAALDDCHDVAIELADLMLERSGRL